MGILADATLGPKSLELNLPDFFFGGGQNENFGEITDRFHQLVQGSFGFFVSKVIAYDVS